MLRCGLAAPGWSLQMFTAGVAENSSRRRAPGSTAPDPLDSGRAATRAPAAAIDPLEKNRSMLYFPPEIIATPAAACCDARRKQRRIESLHIVDLSQFAAPGATTLGILFDELRAPHNSSIKYGNSALQIQGIPMGWEGCIFGGSWRKGRFSDPIDMLRPRIPN